RYMRVLMCPPDYFDVTYEINTWMHTTVKPDKLKACRQWQSLYDMLRDDLGAVVEIVAPQPGLPDMVFTANAGLVWGKTLIPSRFRFAERQGEVAHFVEWFVNNSFTIRTLPEDTPGSFEGEGDVLLYGDILLAGYRQRSDAAAYKALAGILCKEVLPLELADTRWYHLDTCLFPLRPGLLAYYPPAFDEYAQRVLSELPGEKIILSEHDALRFGGNAVVIGEKIAMNSGCHQLAADLQAHGFTTFPTDLSEFLKSGGAAKCLTLLLEH
ncbi:MAG TPA: arginine deiminase-related protein, partial [Capsulimonadaceae bacterium]|nr:arginine deiminase-related protein [Capsulimonadaceae bacterium]